MGAVMAGFGFIPNDPDDSENSGESGRPDFEAMMRQMQEQMKAQFEQLGINPAGFVNPFTTLFSQAGQGNLLKKVCSQLQPRAKLRRNLYRSKV
jgi:hypothetical protein